MTGKIFGRIVIVLLAIGALSWSAEPIAREKINNTRVTLEKWVETQRMISKEKQEWALAREMLGERINLVQNEIESLREKITKAEQSISDADKKRAELVEQNDKLKKSAETLKTIISNLEAQTRELSKRLPDPIRERIKLLTKLIPEDPNNTELSLSQRFSNVLGILNEVNKFNRGEITVTSEVRTLPDGSSAEVTVLYLGLGQAYYTGANGTIAGVGRPSKDGWIWEPANDVANEITDAIAILKNEKVAGFIPLPAKIQ
jgi:uncharacterized phage infection (PIP) family protein YhgE